MSCCKRQSVGLQQDPGVWSVCVSAEHWAFWRIASDGIDRQGLAVCARSRQEHRVQLTLVQGLQSAPSAFGLSTVEHSLPRDRSTRHACLPGCCVPTDGNAALAEGLICSFRAAICRIEAALHSCHQQTISEVHLIWQSSQGRIVW